MRVVLLGTGTPASNPRRSGPATAILVDGRAFIVDAGPGVVRRASGAAYLGHGALSPPEFSRLFITHLHSDHTAGYPDIILSPAVTGRIRALQVYGPKGLTRMTDHLLAAYREDLAIRVVDKTASEKIGYQVQAREIEPGVIHREENIEVRAFKVDHGLWQHALGYRFESRGSVIVVSGDTRPSANTIKACDGCDVLVHEVYCKAGFDQRSPSRQPYHAAHHTSTHELADLARQARPKLLVLSHLLFFGCSEEQLLGEVTSRYDGAVALGNDLDQY